MSSSAVSPSGALGSPSSAEESVDSYQMGGSASSPDEHLLAEQSVGSEGGLTQSPRGTKKKKKKLRSTRAPAAGSAKSKKDLESQSAAPKKTMKELAAEEAAYRKKERLTILRVIITLVIIAAIVVGVVYAISPGPPAISVDPDYECQIQCSGVILETIQFAGLFNDSKTFVDMPILYDPDKVIHSFSQLRNYDHNTLHQWVSANFAPSCSDMLLWSPPDYEDDPHFNKTHAILDPVLAEFGLEVHSLWNLLGRQMSPDVALNPRRHTLLPLRSPHMIVPGGRFCEFYYWDTYWIIQGLLVSGMVDTARTIVDNLVGMVQDYGFVPNGSRRYYLNRSQPPMLTLMVQEVFQATNDKHWLASVFPTLQVEYSFWQEYGTRSIDVQDRNGRHHLLNRYYSSSIAPRPESFVEDELTAWNLWQQKESIKKEAYTAEEHKKEHEKHTKHSAQRLYEQREASEAAQLMGGAAVPVSTPVIPPPPHPVHDNETIIQDLYGQLTAAAETGWDFSSRWFRDRNNLTSVETMDLIPVDLNAILFAVETQLANFSAILRQYDVSALYQANATARMVAIDAVLWNATGAQWQDYHVDRKEWKDEVMVSNFIPLWTKCYDPAFVDEGSVVSALLQSGLVMSGGIVTTLNNNTQQWDFPNAWAPLQWMILEGLSNAQYDSNSDLHSFKIYNSTEKPEPQPASSCDIIHPDSWYNCTTNLTSGVESCTWCFPSGPDISAAIGQQWLLTNYLAWNSTGYMLEKYYAPELGGAGAGGEYQLQKGFGWTNGVALDLLVKHGRDPRFTLHKLMDYDYPFARMAAFVDVSPMIPPHPPQPQTGRPTVKTARAEAVNAWREQQGQRQQQQQQGSDGTNQ